MEAPPVFPDTNGNYTSSLAVDDTQTEPLIKRHRAHQSCEQCRKRKTRCEYSDPRDKSCRRCVREQKRCEFSAMRYKKREPQSRTGGRSFNAAVSYLILRNSYLPDRNAMSPSTRDNGANSHLSIARPPDDLFDLGQANTQFALICEPQQGMTDVAPAPVLGHISGGITNPVECFPGLDAKSRLISTQLRNPADTLDLLTFAATEDRFIDNVSRTDLLSNEATRNSHQPEHGGRLTSDETSRAAWRDFHLIKRGIISEEETLEYVHFFFENLWPLKPVVPAFYANPLMYWRLATEEPVLLTTIIVLGSRYLELSGHHGAIRSERIHWHAWRSLKRNLQSAIWGATCTRSLGTIASMLLLIDWHPKAINNPSMFADEDDIIGQGPTQNDSDISSPEAPLNLTSKQRHGMMSLLENLSVMSSAYRSNKVSWMLLSNAIALAQEGCCFDSEAQAQASSLTDSKTVSVTWDRTICVFIYLMDEHLALRLGLEPMLPEKFRRLVKDRFSKMFAVALPNTELWESYFELTDEISKARELLQTSKHAGSRPNGPELVVELEYVRRRLERWKRQHSYAASDKNSPLNACLTIEYNYALMYSLSPAAYAADANPDHQQESSSASFRQDAVQAARDMLSLVSSVLEPSGVLRVLPETVSQSSSTTEAHQDVKTLRATVEALHRGSPDDIHTAVRFSRFLGVLLDAVLRPTTAHSHAADAKDDSDQLALGASEPALSPYLGPDFGLSALPADLEQFCDSTMWWNETFHFKKLL
ncbi:hypothetical protein LTR84_009001 [Exophiala bonariae]|uniref:Zn(2)-C6 fungal-type domain-containing protein n=1 Tax=Exophiala bonariae TaxID=1690606 RepID=A0AAV9MW28_9EURO|nr:hypothetical protein LTR84_009001 [Exophiala bonariae]